MGLSQKQIADQLADLQISFPNIAPRLLLNLEMDRDVFHGFDTPVQRAMAKHQVPFLLESYVRIGAFKIDKKRGSGYSPLIKNWYTDGKGKSPAARSMYFKSFSDLITDRIAEACPSKMAAATLKMTPERLTKLQDSIWPILKEYLNQEDEDGLGVNIIFCSVLDKHEPKTETL